MATELDTRPGSPEHGPLLRSTAEAVSQAPREGRSGPRVELGELWQKEGQRSAWARHRAANSKANSECSPQGGDSIPEADLL